jgi:4-alpha-glucanotransferase
MTWLTFQIEYGTTWGQQVCICGSIPELGNFDERKALELIPVEGNMWTSTLCVSDISPSILLFHQGRKDLRET